MIYVLNSDPENLLNLILRPLKEEHVFKKIISYENIPSVWLQETKKAEKITVPSIM